MSIAAGRPAAARLTNGGASITLVVVAVVVSIIMLALSSHPTGVTGLGSLVIPVLAFGAVGCWVGVGIRSVRTRRIPVGLVLAPMIALLTVGLLQFSTPSRLRFTLIDQPSFEAIVAQAPEPVINLPARDLTDDESDAAFEAFPGPCPTHIGSLRIVTCSTFAAGYLFYDQAGSGFSDDGGVAYLPHGAPAYDVGNGSFESPHFDHLTGPWYAFSSSW